MPPNSRSTPMDAMQNAYSEARRVGTEALRRARAEIVDRPLDGRKLTPEERQTWWRVVVHNPHLGGMRHQEMAEHFKLKSDKPFSRAFVDRINEGYAEDRRGKNTG